MRTWQSLCCCFRSASTAGRHGGCGNSDNVEGEDASWRSCAAAANLAAHHNDVLERRAELVPGLLRAACQRDAYYAQVFAGEALARLFRRGDAANLNTVAPGAPLARLCKAVAERLMTEPRQKHVAFLSLTQPQS